MGTMMAGFGGVAGVTGIYLDLLDWAVKVVW